MRTIEQVLDHAKKVQKVQSDYKLGLTLGIGLTALSNYRNGRSLPDEKACAKLAHAMGEDPALLTVEMMVQRAKDDEAKQIWLDIAARLQKGVANVRMLAVLAIVAVAAQALPAWAVIYAASNAAVQSVYYVKLIIRVGIARVLKLVTVCKAARDVSSTPHTAAFRPA